MMVGKDDHLGLSLSLSFASSSASASAADHHHRLPLQLNLMPSPSPFFLPQKAATPWTDLLAPPPPAPGERGLRGIDVNRAPAGERESEEDGGGASSPNSTLSSVSGKRGRSSERDLDPAAPAGSDDHDHEADRACSSRGGGIASDEEDGGDGSRKKLRLSKDQSAILEESFKEHNTLNPKQKLALAKQLNLRPRQVEVWFQNRRARTKLKQTEVDCEFLKRCCENLTEENRRLQKEVQELRALKLSPQFYMHMTPPTTLTMCPSCERVSSSCTAAAAPQPNAAPATPSVVAPADFLYSQQQQQHRKVGQAAAAPWAPVPLRAVPFLDAAAAAAAAAAAQR